MKRFHIHVHVDNLSQSIGFYSQLFDAQPTRVESDYAKWMLEDPRLNFAISTRGSKPGLDHLGFQVDAPEELASLKARAQAADMALLDEGATTCCYARSDKHWITDPQGIAWEHFHTLGDIPVFNESADAPTAGACCAPSTPSAQADSCCSPAPAAGAGESASPATSACCAPAQAPAITPAATPATAASCCSPKAGKSCC